jgi:hypothetical protein
MAWQRTTAMSAHHLPNGGSQTAHGRRLRSARHQERTNVPSSKPTLRLEGCQLLAVLFCLIMAVGAGLGGIVSHFTSNLFISNGLAFGSLFFFVLGQHLLDRRPPCPVECEPIHQANRRVTASRDIAEMRAAAFARSWKNN